MNELLTHSLSQRDRVRSQYCSVDLIRIYEYQAKRLNTLEDVGFQDNGDPTEALYIYVLDALGVPHVGTKRVLTGEVDRFTRECSFDREWFDELFYSKYLLENDSYGYDYQDLLRIIREEVRDNLDRHYK